MLRVNLNIYFCQFVLKITYYFPATLAPKNCGSFFLHCEVVLGYASCRFVCLLVDCWQLSKCYYVEDGVFVSLVVSMEEKKRTKVLRTMKGLWRRFSLYSSKSVSSDSNSCLSFGYQLSWFLVKKKKKLIKKKIIMISCSFYS